MQQEQVNVICLQLLERLVEATDGFFVAKILDSNLRRQEKLTPFEAGLFPSFTKQVFIVVSLGRIKERTCSAVSAFLNKGMVLPMRLIIGLRLAPIIRSSALC